MAYSGESVYSGDVPWFHRSPNNPRYRPFGRFANSKPVDLPPEHTPEDKAYYAREKRLDEEVWERWMKPRPPREEEKPDDSKPKVRQESGLVVFWREWTAQAREWTAQARETRDQVSAWYKRTALALDGRLYRAERWYWERSIFPELRYMLGVALKWALALAVLVWFVKGRVDAWRARQDVFVYQHVPHYQVWSVSKPRCGCDADGK